MNDVSEAYEICRDILNDSSETEYAKAYAQEAVNREMTGERLDVQMSYVGSNATAEYKQRIAQWKGLASTDGFAYGYCQICGTRDASAAYHGADTAASGLICIGCYDEFGSPDACSDCGVVTYEGDTFVSGERAGEFYCNTCLLNI